MRGLIFSIFALFSTFSFGMQPALPVAIAVQADCSICQTNLSPIYAELICGHLFHQHCIDQWINSGQANSNKCPICRCPMERVAACVDAIQNNNIQRVRHCLNYLDINQVFLNNRTFLMEAVEKNKIEIFKLLVNFPGVNLNAVNFERNTALTLAIKNESLEMVDILIKAGVNIEGNHHWRVSPFMRACELGNLAIVHRLKEAGANLNARDSDDYTPYTYAASEDKFNIMYYLIGAGIDINESFISCAKNGFLQGMDILISSGNVDINFDGIEENRSGINYAANLGSIEMLDFLLRNNADINHQEENGNTALIECCLSGGLEMARALLNAPGIDIELEDADGHTALYHAVEQNELEIIRVLMENGAQLKQEIMDLNVSDEIKTELLYQSVARDDLPLVQALLQKGVPVTEKILSYENMTPEIQAELRLNRRRRRS